MPLPAHQIVAELFIPSDDTEIESGGYTIEDVDPDELGADMALDFDDDYEEEDE